MIGVIIPVVLATHTTSPMSANSTIHSPKVDFLDRSRSYIDSVFFMGLA